MLSRIVPAPLFQTVSKLSTLDCLNGPQHGMSYKGETTSLTLHYYTIHIITTQYNVSGVLVFISI